MNPTQRQILKCALAYKGRASFAWAIIGTANGAFHAAPDLDFWSRVVEGRVEAWAQADGGVPVLVGSISIEEAERCFGQPKHWL